LTDSLAIIQKAAPIRELQRAKTTLGKIEDSQQKQKAAKKSANKSWRMARKLVSSATFQHP
jgi:hypothetical protein